MDEARIVGIHADTTEAGAPSSTGKRGESQAWYHRLLAPSGHERTTQFNGFFQSLIGLIALLATIVIGWYSLHPSTVPEVSKTTATVAATTAPSIRGEPSTPVAPSQLSASVTTQEPASGKAVGPTPALAASASPSFGVTVAASLSDLKRNLGETEGITRFYALQEGMASLPVGARLSVREAMDLLRGIADPSLRYEVLSTGILPRIALPLSAGDAVTLLDGIPRFNRRDLLQRLAPCIVRPATDPQADELIEDVPSMSRQDFLVPLRLPLSCPPPTPK